MFESTMNYEDQHGIPVTVSFVFKDSIVNPMVVEVIREAYYEVMEFLDNIQDTNVTCDLVKWLLNRCIYYNTNSEENKEVISSIERINTMGEGIEVIINIRQLATPNLHKYISMYISSNNRELLPWESTNKKFIYIEDREVVEECLRRQEIMQCILSNEDVFFFNIGLEAEPDITDEMLEKGNWFMYCNIE